MRLFKIASISGGCLFLLMHISLPCKMPNVIWCKALEAFATEGSSFENRMVLCLHLMNDRLTTLLKTCFILLPSDKLTNQSPWQTNDLFDKRTRSNKSSEVGPANENYSELANTEGSCAALLLSCIALVWRTELRHPRAEEMIKNLTTLLVFTQNLPRWGCTAWLDPISIYSFFHNTLFPYNIF